MANAGQRWTAPQLRVYNMTPQERARLKVKPAPPGQTWVIDPNGQPGLWETARIPYQFMPF